MRTRTTPGADFTGLETYLLAPIPPESEARPRYTRALGETIQRGIATELDAKGYRAVTEAADADMIVSFYTRGQPRVRRVNAAQPEADVYVEQEYVAGSLVIEVHDGEGELLWQARGYRDVFETTDIEELSRDVARTLLAGFPP